MDKKYLAWLHTQPCLVSNRSPVTVHHVRRFGEPKDDLRTVPLIAEYHLHEAGMWSVERIGKARFEAHFRVNFEQAIREYNQRYEEEHEHISSEN